MHASKDVLPVETLVGGYEARLVEWGDYTAYFERIPASTDYTAFYDRCECPHMGYVFKGKLLFVHSNGNEEVVSAGEMYYIPPGHVFHVLEDAETVEFSPSLAYRQHMEKVARNMAAASRGDA